MIEYDDVVEAAGRVRGVARRTPLTRSHVFSERAGADVFLKLENTQRTGAFKIRGATNRIETLSSAQREAGVVTASAGNHGQGVALAASRLGVDATVVMPERAAVSKVEATEHYGATVILDGTDYDEAATRAHELEATRGLTYVHAFEDDHVMAGQGTVGLEIVEDCPEVDTVVVPVGGGGLIAGVATALKGQLPDTRVVGVQAEGAASAARSLAAGEIVELDSVDTIADGLAARRVGDRTFAVIRDRVDDVVTVSDSEIAVAVMLALERAKTLVEGAGAVPLAALLAGTIEVEPDETVVAVLSGGNIDMNMLTTVLVRGLIETGRYLRIRTVLPDRPGALVEFGKIIANHGANIYAFSHDRTSRDIGLNDAEVEVDLETRGPGHVEALLADLRDHGYEVSRANGP